MKSYTEGIMFAVNEVFNVDVSILYLAAPGACVWHIDAVADGASSVHV